MTVTDVSNNVSGSHHGSDDDISHEPKGNIELILVKIKMATND